MPKRQLLRFKQPVLMEPLAQPAPGEVQSYMEIPEDAAGTKRLVKQLYYQLDRFRIKVVTHRNNLCKVGKTSSLYTKSLKALTRKDRFKLLQAWVLEGGKTAEYVNKFVGAWASGDLFGKAEVKQWSRQQALFTWNGPWGCWTGTRSLGTSGFR